MFHMVSPAVEPEVLDVSVESVSKSFIHPINQTSFNRADPTALIGEESGEEYEGGFVKDGTENKIKIESLLTTYMGLLVVSS